MPTLSKGAQWESNRLEARFLRLQKATVTIRGAVSRNCYVGADVDMTHSPNFMNLGFFIVLHSAERVDLPTSKTKLTCHPDGVL